MHYRTRLTRPSSFTRLALAFCGLVLLTLPACDSLLEENPQDFVSPTNFYQTEDDALAALSGAYAGLHWTGSLNSVRLFLLPTAMMTTFAEPGQTLAAIGPTFDGWTWTASTAALEGIWVDIYEAINPANAVIDNVPSINMDEALRQRIIAEARFLRAFHYFALVRIFGGVPLRKHEVTSLDSLQTPRASADQVYNFIISELQDIQGDLPPISAYNGPEKARVSRGAAKTLLAKVYLQRGGGGTVTATPQPDDFQNAARLLKEVIDSGEYSLVPDYGGLFFGNNERNAETIFSIEHINADGQGPSIHIYAAPLGSNWGPRQSSGFHGEQDFYLNYSEGDERFDPSWLTEYIDPEGKRRVFDPSNPQNDGFAADGPAPEKLLYKDPSIGYAGPRDFLQLRYAGVLLMYAEALNEINGGPTSDAYSAINQVRNRAGLPDLTPDLNYNQFKDSLFYELRWEFTQEFKGWFFGQRYWERFKKVVEASADKADPRLDTHPNIDFEIQEPKHRLFPIPQDAIERNPKLEQNPGY